MNKKAFELSINFIVMLILAIVVFGFGLYFAQKVFTEANVIKAQLDKDSENRIMALLDRGEMVAFPISSKEVKENQLAIFGLGVLNVNNAATQFKVTVKCSTYVSPSGKEDTNKCSGKWTLEVAPFTLAKNNKKVVPIAIQPPAGKPSGTYAFNVNVTDTLTNKIYGGAPKQIYLTIV